MARLVWRAWCGAPGVASLQQPVLASPVVRRKLLPLWSAAAASGENIFECHVNKTRSCNQLAFACHGAHIIFGDKRVAGVAVCASGACTGEAKETLLAQVPAHLQDSLKAFWADAGRQHSGRLRLLFVSSHFGAVAMRPGHE